MKRPGSVVVLGKTYKVQYLTGAPLSESDIGEHDMQKQLISIRDGLHSQQEASAFLHECLHAISDALGVGLTEAQVLALETGLFALFKDNRDFGVYLISGKK
jgi:hypothetical protein